MADQNNPWAGLSNLGAIDQKLYQPPKKETTPPPPQPKPPKRSAVKDTARPVRVKPPKSTPQERKMLLGARITPQQYAIFKKLYLRLNNNDLSSDIDKGEILGLAIETLAQLLEETHEDYPTVNKLKSYLVNKLTKSRGS